MFFLLKKVGVYVGKADMYEIMARQGYMSYMSDAFYAESVRKMRGEPEERNGMEKRKIGVRACLRAQYYLHPHPLNLRLRSHC
jgi:hypothetical protein